MTKEQLIKEFREKFTREDGLLDIGKYDDEIVEDIISSAFDAGRASGIEEEVKKEIKMFMHAIQEKANVTKPNLILNEVVNYAYDRIKALTPSSSKDDDIKN